MYVFSDIELMPLNHETHGLVRYDCFVLTLLTFKKYAHGKIKKNKKKVRIITLSERCQMSINRKMFKHSPVQVFSYQKNNNNHFKTINV